MKRTFKNLFAILILSQLVSSCEKEDRIQTSRDLPEANYNGSQLSSLPVITLRKDSSYIITGAIIRNRGQQLVIEPGTIVKFELNGSILINPGGLLVASGTPEEPIVFTSAEPAGLRAANWGGIEINGNSFNSETNPAGDSLDVSGSLIYARIEFAPLILRSVGAGTVIDHVQVSYADRGPAYSIIGGSFNAKYLVSYGTSSSIDFYFSRGYHGNLQFLLAHRVPYFGNTDPAGTNGAPFDAIAGLFIENSPYNSLADPPYTNVAISNLTVIGPNNVNGTRPIYVDTLTRVAALLTTSSALFQIRNSIFMGFPSTAWLVDEINTAGNLVARIATVRYSAFQSLDTSKVFAVPSYLVPGIGNVDFKAFTLDTLFKNRLFLDAGQFKFRNPFDYNVPDASLDQFSELLNGADFSTPVFSNAFYNNVSYVGAFDTRNWTVGWTNFDPINTNYNNLR